MAQDERKAELTAKLALSRTQITEQARLLGHDLDWRTRSRRAFSRHPAVWIGAAALIGLVIARFPLRRKAPAPHRKSAEPVIEKAEKAGLLLTALKIGFDLARPALTKWVTRWVMDYFARRAGSDYARR